MKNVIKKAMLVALGSAGASASMTAVALPLLGGSFSGNAVLLSILCPIVIAFPASAYTTWQADRLRTAHGALARAHAELSAAHRRLAEKARRDDMTGMLNREAFFGTLDGSRRKTDRGALLIIDADHFKRINDTHGHLVGDQALLKIAAAISRAVRTGDILGRIGGEEFGAFLVGATDQEATHVAERIRREVEAIRFRPDGSATLPLTVSIGGTGCGPDSSVSELMRAADKRLYEAKQGGRNLSVFETRWAA